MRYKAIFIDVDGTLVSPDSPLLPSERTKEAITKAQARGVYVGLATARPLEQCRHIIDYLGLRGPSVFSGGAEIVDTSTNTTLREHILTRDHLTQFFSITESRHASFWVQDNGTDCEYNDSYIPYKPYIAVAQDIPLVEVDSILQECESLEAVIALRSSGSRYDVLTIHVAPCDATKEKGVEYVSKLLSIQKEEIMGIGDGFNDILLMNACGLKVAMEDSVPELLEVATYVTGTVESDGVSDAIEKFILTE